MENYPENNPENNFVQTEYPSFEEHMAEISGESGDGNNPPENPLDTPPENTETIKSPEQRQVEDLEVLFSFCDEEDILEILKSDSYGTLLNNNVSLVDLFNANALFNEQYEDGYATDSYWRDKSPLNIALSYRYSPTGQVYYDPLTRVKLKKGERDDNKKSMLEYRGMMLAQGDSAAYLKLEEEGVNPADDIIRAKEAKETISEIANTYFGDGASSEIANEIKNIISIRADGKELSEEQKTFLRNEHNTVADRLLYDGHTINEERAYDIVCNIEELNDREVNPEHTDAVALLVEKMGRAQSAIGEFVRADRADLIYDAKNQLESLVDKHFDTMIAAEILDYNELENIDNLVFNYSNPYRLAERAKKFGLCNTDDDRYYYIDNPDRIVDCIAERGLWVNPIIEKSRYFSKQAESLKELGVSDDAILRNCQDLRPVDFIDAESDYDGSGSRLVEAGIDRKKIIKEVFSSTLHYKEKAPFEKENYPFKGESRVEVLERNGFDMTDIAKTFSPDDISKNIAEFIERGADARELMKHMINYREAFEDNIVRDDEGEISGWKMEHINGVQNVMVWDKNHPEGRMVKKEGMRGKGLDYVAMNLDILADNGVTEEDIINQISDTNYSAPFGMFIPKMLECRKFDTQKVLNLGYTKYTKYLKSMEEEGVFDKEYVEKASAPSDYYAKIVEQLSGTPKERRDKYYRDLVVAQ